MAEKLDEFGMPMLVDPDAEDGAEEVEQEATYAEPPSLQRLEWKTRRYGEEYLCWAEFNDPMDLTGDDIRKLRRAGGNGGNNRGEIANQLLNAALTMLISAWEIPYLVNVPIPSAGQQPAAILGMLGGFDLKRLENHVLPVIRQITGGRVAGQGNEGNGPGSPTTPARG